MSCHLSSARASPALPALGGFSALTLFPDKGNVFMDPDNCREGLEPCRAPQESLRSSPGDPRKCAVRSKPGLLLCPGRGNKPSQLVGFFPSSQQVWSRLLLFKNCLSTSTLRCLSNAGAGGHQTEQRSRVSFLWRAQHCCPRVSALNHIPLPCNKANFQILSSSSICHFIKIVLK